TITGNWKEFFTYKKDYFMFKFSKVMLTFFLIQGALMNIILPTFIALYIFDDSVTGWTLFGAIGLWVTILVILYQLKIWVEVIPQRIFKKENNLNDMLFIKKKIKSETE